MDSYGGYYELSHIIKGVPLQCMVRIRPTIGYQKEDIRVNGDRISLLDVNNKAKEEFICSDIFTADQPMSRIFDTSFSPYLRAITEGVNVSIFLFGSTGSGKTHCVEGTKTDTGMVSLLADNLFTFLEDKRQRQNLGGGRNPTFTYSIKIKYVEIVDEEVTDLLSSHANMGHQAYTVVNNEWEGPTINGVKWTPMSSQQQLVEYFLAGTRRRTTGSNEFGKLSERSTTMFSIEITQIAEIPATGETTVVISKLNLIDLPGCEILAQSPEDLAIHQGTTLNKGIVSFNNLITDLSTSKQTDYVYYDSSAVTSLFKDALGGNSLTIGLFTLQYGDHIGSSITLNALRKCQNIINYPIINDNRSIGLLKKFRVEANQLQNNRNFNGEENSDNYNMKIAELEKRLIDDNLDRMRFAEDRQKLSKKMAELKEKFNLMVKQKADLQGELIKSEEEKLKVSKACIELQIENTKLQESTQNDKFDVNSKLLYAENEKMELSMKEEKAAQAIHELQEKLRESLEEKKEMEIEFIVLRKNFHNMQSDLDQEKMKNENLSIELINLVNENRSINKDSSLLSKEHGSAQAQNQNITKKATDLEKENRDLKESILGAKGEIERLKTEIIKMELKGQQNQLDFDSKKVALEKEFIDVKKSTAGEKIIEYKNMSQGDLLDNQLRIKQLTRKVEELTDELRESQTMTDELTVEKNKLSLQLEEMRGSFRNKLTKYLNDNGDRSKLTMAAKEELIRSYTEREMDLQEQLEKEQKKCLELRRKVKALRFYARGLKSLAEDWAPSGQPLPEILVMPPPAALDDDESEQLKHLNYEVDKLRSKNRLLEEQLKEVHNGISYVPKSREGGPASKTSDSHMQQRILKELEYLKGNPDVLSRAGSANVDVDRLRRERNELLDENKKLKALLNEDSAGPSSGNLKYLKQKIFYLEKSLQQLEKERSELSVRATFAEEQHKTLQDLMTTTTHQNQKKIAELQKILRAKGVDHKLL